MAAKRLIFSPAAEADLEQIWRYTAETWNPDQADEYIMQIHSSCPELATGRRKGRSLSPAALQLYEFFAEMKAKRGKAAEGVSVAPRARDRP